MSLCGEIYLNVFQCIVHTAFIKNKEKTTKKKFKTPE